MGNHVSFPRARAGRGPEREDRSEPLGLNGFCTRAEKGKRGSQGKESPGESIPWVQEQFFAPGRLLVWAVGLADPQPQISA